MSPSFETAGNLGPSISNSAWSARDETDLVGLASEKLHNSWDKNDPKDVRVICFDEHWC